jgi:hypothetical protein
VVGVTILEFSVAVWTFIVIEAFQVTFVARLGCIGNFVFQFEAAFRTELFVRIIHSDHAFLTSYPARWAKRGELRPLSFEEKGHARQSP